MYKNNDTTSRPQSALSRRKALGILALGSAGTAIPSLVTGQGAVTSEPVVETAYGKVRGFTDKGVSHFLGVRYGAPAGGENRFKAARAPQAWTGVQDARAFGNSAMQRNPDSAAPASPDAPGESEDCLFLNIYTSSPAQGRLRPVMVWLHGGAFSSGSAATPDVHGANLVRRGDAVVVGVNHRLNGFGFTHLAAYGGAELAHSGNVGMLDIVQALQWVQANIDRFGGDPSRVMIFGESGGGQKVATLLTSPLARGLFSRAVIESGPGVRMVEESAALETGDLFVRELGLTRSTFSKIYALPEAQLLRAYFSTLAKRGGIVAGFVNDFGPVIDQHFLIDHPFSDSTLNIAAEVPVILGWNRTEMTLFAQGDASAFNLDDNGLRQRVAGIHGEQNVGRVIDIYRTKYLQLSASDLYFLIWSDYPTMQWSNYIAAQRASQGLAGTWLYRFDWETPVRGGMLKSPHTLEIPFVFDNIAFTPDLTGTGADAFRLAAKMSETWLRFAETGDPNTVGAVLPAWQPYTLPERNTMLLNDESRLVADPQREERQLLDAMYPLS